MLRKMMVLGLLTGSSMLIACQREPLGVEATPQEMAVTRGTIGQYLSARPKSFDDEMLELGQTAPGFAGVTVEDSQVVIRVTERANRSRAEAAVRSWGGGKVHALSKPVRWRTVRYDFATLSSVRRQIRPLQISGLSWIDIDEAANRVVVAVNSAADIAAARQYLTATVHSMDVVDVVVSARPKPAADLNDYVRPVMGGLRFNNAFAGPGPCSVGAILTQTGGSDRYMLTNSHCTNLQYEPDGSVAHQPYVWEEWGTSIATEILDPLPAIFPSCYDESNCRWSDAAIYHMSNSSTPFTIAKTTWVSTQLNTPGSTTISAEGPFTVTGTVA